MSTSDGVSVVVPSFFSANETVDTIEIMREALGVDVADSGLRAELASAEAEQPIQIVLQFIGAIGMGALGNAAWAGMVFIAKRLCERFPKRHISIEIRAESPSGRAADYYFPENGSDAALQAIVTDVERNVRGTRVAYDVDEGWLTWEESSEKRRRAKRANEEPPASA